MDLSASPRRLSKDEKILINIFLGVKSKKNLNIVFLIKTFLFSAENYYICITLNIIKIINVKFYRIVVLTFEHGSLKLANDKATYTSNLRHLKIQGISRNK